MRGRSGYILGSTLRLRYSSQYEMRGQISHQGGIPGPYNVAAVGSRSRIRRIAAGCRIALRQPAARPPQPAAALPGSQPGHVAGAVVTEAGRAAVARQRKRHASDMTALARPLVSAVLVATAALLRLSSKGPQTAFPNLRIIFIPVAI
eukprot:COSAG01_NODE_35006_length_538_cov_2.248292_1_plen_147_part_10